MITDVDAALQGTHAIAGVAGAAGGGLGVFWLARLLFRRMVVQYDRMHRDQAQKLERVAEKFSEAVAALQTKVAVVETLVTDARQVRGDTQTAVQGVQQQIANTRAELVAALKTTRQELEGLHEDVYVAHRRLELLAKGDTDITKVQKQPRRLRT